MHCVEAVCVFLPTFGRPHEGMAARIQRSVRFRSPRGRKHVAVLFHFMLMRVVGSGLRSDMARTTVCARRAKNDIHMYHVDGLVSSGGKTNTNVNPALAHPPKNVHGDSRAVPESSIV